MYGYQLIYANKVKEFLLLMQSSHSYGMSHAIWDHTELPATQQRRTHPALTPTEAGTRFINHLRMNG